MGYKQVSYGSAGEDVKKLQALLNEKGYALAEDGIFGAKTQAAVKDYQSKNALVSDGIAGAKTWGSLLSAPKAETQPVQQTYTESDTAKGISRELENLKATAPGDYVFDRQQQWDDLVEQILSREDFDYDMAGDALYQQYKDSYTTAGRMAMMDTLGQAAAKTGGYGNSYAQTAGQQAYNAYLQKLNDVMPELYQMALQRYNAETDALYESYDALNNARSDSYDRYRDTVSDYNAQLDRLTDRLDTQREFDYTQYRDTVEDAREAEKQAEDNRRFQLEYALQQAQLAVSQQKASATATKEGLSVSEYNAIHSKCAEYAKIGADALAAYLQGLVEQGSISESLAAVIVESFFPTYEEKQSTQWV